MYGVPVSECVKLIPSNFLHLRFNYHDMAKTKTSSFVYIVASMICWAFSFVWVKIAYESFGPISTVFLRLVISTVLLFAFLLLTRKIDKIKRKDFKHVLLLAFFEPFMYFMGESFGMQLVSSTLASVIISTIPLFATMFAFLFLKERITPITVLGITLSFFGVGTMIFENGFELSASFTGIALMFVAVFSAVGYTVVLKNLADKYSPVNIIAYQNLIGIFMFAPFLVTWELDELANADFSADSLLAILQLAVFASSLAFIFYTKALKFLGVAKSNMFINLIPVFTALFAWWLRGDLIDFQKALGIVIVVTGLFVSQIRKRKNEA